MVDHQEAGSSEEVAAINGGGAHGHGASRVRFTLPPSEVSRRAGAGAMEDQRHKGHMVEVNEADQDRARARRRLGGCGCRG